MARILRRPQAATDILDIWDYIAEDSLEQADAWVDRLDVLLQTVSRQPGMGRARPELAPRLRSLPFGRYVVLYLPMEDGIDLIRVLHSARDIGPDLMEGDLPA